MRSILGVLPFTALTFFSWGIYGPVLHHGKSAIGDSSLRQLICVGLAYFVFAIIVPVVVLRTNGESGHWTVSGTIWSLIAGSCGALGALGIISSLNHGGSPIYVMPLVFGCAPVVNTFVSMWMTKTFKDAGPIFFIGIGVVALGAAGVMYFKPGAAVETGILELQIRNAMIIVASVTLTALCWGSYGSVLHKGQMKMGGSRLRPFLCVGMAYFLIAVIVPMIALNMWPVEKTWAWSGVWWSLAAGAAGAMGALGIILSFTFGGKPVFVMPLVFGGAPVVNTFATMIEKGTISEIPVTFLLSLLMVICGAVTVLIFAPKPKPKGAGKPEPPAKDEPKASDEPITDDEPKDEAKEEPSASTEPLEDTETPSEDADEEVVEEKS